jgi:hypothetical protein
MVMVTRERTPHTAVMEKMVQVWILKFNGIRLYDILHTVQTVAALKSCSTQLPLCHRHTHGPFIASCWHPTQREPAAVCTVSRHSTKANEPTAAVTALLYKVQHTDMCPGRTPRGAVVRRCDSPCNASYTRGTDRETRAGMRKTRRLRE